MTLPEEEKNKVGRPQRYVLWKDWERWILLEWMPFKNNEFNHLQTDVVWLKVLTIGILLSIVATAIAIIATR